MGTPIKDRGIKWNESYRDKSLSLKEHYESAVGPGSYYRWEGHDSSTSTDYYVAITPGRSKKKGYYFFAALRKIPEEHGSSGKKFKSQPEAISYAIETWNIPTPKSPFHKPYTTEDLIGKIISEREASLAGTVRTSGRGAEMAVIDASITRRERPTVTASLLGSGRQGQIFPVVGQKDAAFVIQYAARAALTMGWGAAMSMCKQFGIVDVLNQREGRQHRDVASGQRSSEVVPKMATCEAPLEQSFNELVRNHGIVRESPLYKVTAGGVQLSEPAYPDAQENSPTYRLIRLSENISDLRPVVKVGWGKRDEFRRLMSALSANETETVVDSAGNPVLDRNSRPQQGLRLPDLDSTGQPAYLKNENGSLAPASSTYFRRNGRGEVISLVREEQREENRRRRAPGRSETRRNYYMVCSVPADLMGAFRKAIAGVGTIGRMPFQNENALDLFNHFKDAGQLDTPEGFSAAMRTPMYERSTFLNGSLIIYNKDTLEPIGIKVSKTDKSIRQEGNTEEGTKEEVQHQFAPGVVSRLIHDPVVQQMPGRTPYEKLRMAFLRDSITLTPDMFIDCRTAAHRLHRVVSEMPRFDDNLVPEVDPETGKIVFERKGIVPTYRCRARSGRVRQFDRETGEDVIVQKPEEVPEEQSFDGVPALVNGIMFMLVRRRDAASGEDAEVVHPMEEDVQEITLYDVNSRGKYITGSVFTIMCRPGGANASHRDLRNIYALGQERDGFFLGQKEIKALTVYKEGSPTNDHLGPLDGQNWRLSKVISVFLADGTKLDFPEDGSVNSPAGQAILRRRRDITGYEYIKQRQWAPKPLMAGSPTTTAPIVVQKHERMPDGSMVLREDEPPLRITLEDLANPDMAGESGNYYTRLKLCMDILKYKFGMSDLEIGRYVDTDMRALKIIDDKTIRAKDRIEAVARGELNFDDLTPQEQLLAQEHEHSEYVPSAYLQRTGTIGENPEDFEPLNGPIWGVYNLVREEFVSTARKPTVFGTEEQATEFIRHLVAARGNAADFEIRVINRKPDGSYGPLLPMSWEQEQEAERNPASETQPLVAGRASEGALEDLMGPAQPPPGTPPGEESVARGLESEENLEEITQQPPPPPGGAPVPVSRPDPLLEQFRNEGEELEEIPVATPAAPTARPPVKPDREAASGVERLVRLADRLDEQGKHAEADAVDRLIRITAERAKGN